MKFSLSNILVSLVFVFLSKGICAQKKEDADVLTITKILSVTIDSSINPATYNFLATEHKRAVDEGSHAFLIKINTPGGLVTTTKDILTIMGNSSIPIIVWITPEGASASSAGAILACGAHVLAMSSGTNIGAATPVQLGKGIDDKDLRKKAINDLVTLVQSLSETRGRNAALFGKMVEDAASFKAQEALDKKLIDFLANTEQEILAKMDGMQVQIKGSKFKLSTSPSTTVTERQMDVGQRLLNVLASPDLSYMLFMLGAALIYFEFQTTGFFAGALGAICLILAGIGFQVLPLNFGALGLIVLAFILFLLETYITSHGLLSVAGLGALLLGSLFLFRTDQAYISVSRSLIFTCVGVVASFILAMLWYLIRERKKQKIPDDYYSLVGKEGVVLSLLESDGGNFHYQIRIAGEIWHAHSTEEYKVGDNCIIKADSKGLTLKI